MHKITMLGTGLIGSFYTATLLGQRSRDQVKVVCSRTIEEAQAFAEKHNIPRATTSIAEAVNDPETDVVVIGLPNNLHKEAALLAAQAGKAILCTKPLGRNAQEALEMLEAATWRIWFTHQKR
jgi:predicted dehydrogenase